MGLPSGVPLLLSVASDDTSDTLCKQRPGESAGQRLVSTLTLADSVAHASSIKHAAQRCTYAFADANRLLSTGCQPTCQSCLEQLQCHAA